MTRSILLSGLSLLALSSTALTSPALAQQAAPAAQPAGPATAQSQAPAAIAQQQTTKPAVDADDPYSAQDSEVGAEVTVTGERERGSVPGDIKPELTLSPADIRTYGVSSINDLLTAIAPQTTSGRGGMPVILLNGRRISSFAEIRDLPTEAIERAEVLPEEASLKYGYRADQRVVNIVLRRRFHAWTAEVSGGGSTDGGKETGSAEATRLNISRDKRFSITGHWDGGTQLQESERDITRSAALGNYDIIGNVTAPGGGNVPGTASTVLQVPDGLNGRPTLGQFIPGSRVTDLAPFRSLSPASRTASINATYARNVNANVGMSINARYEATASSADQGLAAATYTVPTTNPFSPFSNTVQVNRYLVGLGALQRRSTGSSAHIGTGWNGDFSPKWRWSFIANYDRTVSDSRNATGIDISGLQSRFTAGDTSVNPFGAIAARDLGSFNYDTGNSTNSVGGASFLTNGTVFELPAGNVNTAIKFGFETSDFVSDALRSGVASHVDLGRDTKSGQVNLDVPITSKSRGFGGAIGNLTANANYAVDRLSDFGTLTTYGYGLNWQPITPLRFMASRQISEDAPSTSQIGSPVLITPNVRVFDYIQGTSVDITQINGGNSALLANHKESTKLSLNWQPLNTQARNLSFIAEYVTTHTDNPTASFPAATAAIEAAFPGRFVRDGSGRLISIDARPVNFQSEDLDTFRWGFNFSSRIGPAPQPRQGFFGGGRRPDGAPPEGAPPSGDGGPAPASGAGGSAGSRGGGGGGPGGPGGGGGSGFRGGGFGAGPGGGGRLSLSVYHTIYLKDRINIRPGVAPLDLLNGQAAGGAGGQPEHKVQVQAGVSKGPYGLFVAGNWQSATHVDGGTAAVSSNLRFAPLSTFDLRAFVNFQPGMKAVRNNPWLLGSRVSLSVSNVFNERQRVTDTTGATPVNYQPDLLDPTGRTIKLTFRKLFFSIPAGARPFFNQAIRGR